MSTKYPIRLTWEEENPTLYQSLLWEDICGNTSRRLEKTMKRLRKKPCRIREKCQLTREAR